MAPEEEHLEIDADPRESPFELPPIDCLPFAGDAEKAQAIRRIVEQAERERASSPNAARQSERSTCDVAADEPLSG
jgi:hypothetical protein